jgi:hypothetical protein
MQVIQNFQQALYPGPIKLKPLLFRESADFTDRKIINFPFVIFIVAFAASNDAEPLFSQTLDSIVLFFIVLGNIDGIA